MVAGDRNPRSGSYQVDLNAVLTRFTDAFHMLLFDSIRGFQVRSGPSTENLKSWPHPKFLVTECYQVIGIRVQEDFRSTRNRS